MNNNIREIPLGKSGKVAIVDADYYDWLTGFDWNISNAGYAIYSTTTNGNPVNYLMHRLVNDTPQDMQTHHINGDRLDNRRSNLKAVTISENMRHRGLFKNNKSGYKGVSWKKDENVWQVKIRVDGKLKHVGHFKDINIAAHAYNKAALEYFGANAALNAVL